MESKLKKRLVLVCDDEKTCELYSNVLETSPVSSGALVKSFSSLKSSTQSITKISADMLILGVKFFGSEESEFVEFIKEKNSRIEILLILDSVGFDQISIVLSSGISGIVLKTAGLLPIVQAVQDICQGGAYLSPALARLLVESYWLNQFSPLTSRETEVLKLITEGKTYSEIARKLEVSLETSKTHIRNIYRKLDVNSKSEVVMRAINDKLVPV